MEDKKVSIDIKNPEIIILLLFLAAIFIMEIIVTIPSPIAFGDEGYHTSIAEYIAQHKELPAWNPVEYTKLIKFSFSRPPLWHLTLAGFDLIFGAASIIVKLLVPFIATILTGIVIFLIGKNAYNRKVGLVAAVTALTTASYVTYSVLFYVDMLLVFYFSLFFLTFILATKTNRKRYWILSGVFAAFAFLTKIPSLVIFPFLAIALLYQIYKERDLRILKNYFILAVPLILIISSFFIKNLVSYGALSCEIPILSRGSNCLQTFDYKTNSTFEGVLGGGGTDAGVTQIGIMNFIKFAYGNAWFILLGFVGGLVIILLRREKTDILTFLILLSFTAVFYVGFRGRSEDASRYVLSLVPILGLLIANYFFAIYEYIKKYLGIVSIFVFILVFVIGFIGFNEKLNTMKSVKAFSPSFFEACDFIKQNTPKDAIITTVWDHQAVYNCKRSSVGYGNLPDGADIVLSNDLNLILSRLEAHGINHIFVQKFSLSPQKITTRYPISFVQFLEEHPSNFKKVFENGPDIQTCIQQGGCDGTMVYEVIQ